MIRASSLRRATLLALVFAACGGAADAPTATGALGEDAVLSGTIDGWTYGSGYVLVPYLNGVVVNPSDYTAISDAGAFSVKLPSRATLSTSLVALKAVIVPGSSTKSCTTSPTFVPDSSRGFSFAAFDAVNGSKDAPVVLCDTLSDAGTQTCVGLIYVDADTAVHGTLAGCADYGSLPINLDLRAGWNSVQITYQKTKPTDVHTAPIPSSLKWLAAYPPR